MSETSTGKPETGGATRVPRSRQSAEEEVGGESSESSGGGLLGFIERAGDKIPNPALMFLILCGIVIVLSQILYLCNVSATSEVAVPPTTHSEVVEEGIGSVNPGYDLTPAEDPGAYTIHRETTKVQGLLTGDGVRFMFTETVDNFNGFGVAGTILVAMIGVGVAEEAGLIGALIRKLVKRAPPYDRPGRDHLQHRLRRRVPGADPAGRSRLLQPRQASAGRPGRGLRRR
jgi:hypothetical protein